MARPRFRNEDKFQRLPHRDWLRENQPEGTEGYVVEDLDLLLRCYGSAYGTDGRGRFMFCELKYYPHTIGYAQRKTFGLVDGLLRKADPNQKRYLGYYQVQYDNDDWSQSRFWVNGQELDTEDFLRFTGFDDDLLEEIQPYEF